MWMQFVCKFLLSLGVVFFAAGNSFAKTKEILKKETANKDAVKKDAAKKESVQKETTKKEDLTELNAVIKKYRSAQLVKMNVVKTVKSELMGKETKFNGFIYYAEGKFRWDNDTPEKTQLIFDGQTIWNVQHPPAELGGPLQVAKSKIDKNTKKQILVSTLISTPNVSENFKIKNKNKEKTKDNGVVTTFELSPKSSELGISNLKLKTTDKKAISEISYKDDVGNVTTIQFQNIEFSKKAQSNLFKYVPPKGAQVTNI